MTAEASPAKKVDWFEAARNQPVGGPVAAGWREGTLTRAKELESLCASVLADPCWENRENHRVLAAALLAHITAARQAAEPTTARHLRYFRRGSLMERALSNLHAAEANLLSFAPPDYLLGQLPCLLRHVRCHLKADDPRLHEFERVAERLALSNPERSREDLRALAEDERGRIASIARAASSEALREQVRVRSFRNVLVVTTLSMTLIAIAMAVVGFLRPTMIPMCFAPEEAGQAVVVCPTKQSDSFAVLGGPETETRDIDDRVSEAAVGYDILVVELVGLVAAAVAAAAAIRGIRGSSERYGLPVALAALKLPTGAVTAFLGILLLRGEFVPGLSALDTSAQILAWALVFGYAQQVFTRLVDRQGQSVLDSVRGADKAPPRTESASRQM